MASGRPNRRLFSPTAPDAINKPLVPINCSPPPSPCPPLPLPLPLPLPPPLPPFSDQSTTIRLDHSRSILPALSVAAASVVSVSTIMILLTLLLIRLRRRSSAAREDPVAAAAPLEDDDGGDGDGEEVMHHVWYIRTVGLDESSIESITAWAYKAGDGVLGAFATGCSVCLSEFRDGELVRLLPKCDHAFHLGCIDTWLRSHVNCPLCRAPIFAPTSVTAATSPFSSSLPPPESGVVTGPNTVASTDNDQMADRQIDLSPGTSEEELEGERSELGAGNRAVAVPIPSAELQVPTDIGEDEFLPIRRSFSVNSISPELEEGLRNINNKKKQALEENLHARTTTRAKHVRHASSFRKEMGRSLASASERFIFSVNGRARSSVFPQ